MTEASIEGWANVCPFWARDLGTRQLYCEFQLIIDLGSIRAAVGLVRYVLDDWDALRKKFPCDQSANIPVYSLERRGIGSRNGK